MSVRKAFEDAWEAKFPETPVPTCLPFLDEEGVSSLGAALDSADRAIKELEQDLVRQQFIHDFVLQQLNLSLAARSDYAALPDVASNQRGTSPASKTPPVHLTSFGQSARGHRKTSQLAAVMAKIGFGKVNRPAVDSEDEDRTCSMEDISDGKKATPLSRFYDKSNMCRASSEPSLIDYGRKYKPQPAIPPTSTSRMPPGFKPVFTKDPHAKLTSSVSANTSENSCFRPSSPVTLLRKSTGSGLDYRHRQHSEEPLASAEMYLETDLDSVIPPALTPTLPAPCVDKLELDVLDAASPVRPRRPRSNIYEELKECRRGIPSLHTETKADEDDRASSDEEQLYMNILQFNQQALSCANALYANGAALMTSPGSSDNEKLALEQRRRRRMVHHYEHMDPQLMRPLSLPPVDADSGECTFSCCTCIVHVLV